MPLSPESRALRSPPTPVPQTEVLALGWRPVLLPVLPCPVVRGHCTWRQVGHWRGVPLAFLLVVSPEPCQPPSATKSLQGFRTEAWRGGPGGSCPVLSSSHCPFLWGLLRPQHWAPLGTDLELTMSTGKNGDLTCHHELQGLTGLGQQVGVVTV